MTALELALQYAKLGLNVIPIPSGYKYPFGIDNWQDLANSDPARISHYYANNPSHGVGIATGPGSGVFLIDVDNHDDGPDGAETLADLEHELGALPDTWEVVTGSGGRHLYFRIPDGADIPNDAGKRLGPGLDIRGTGGQGVAPPSIHPTTGRAYMWELSHDPTDGAELADIPAAWLAYLTREDKPAEPRQAPAPRPFGIPTPGDIWASAHSWPEILGADGWTLHSSRTDHKTNAGYELWTRPGKDRKQGASASLYYGGTDCLKVFTTTPPAGLKEGETYTRYGYMVATKYAGDFEVATRTLGAEQRANGTAAPRQAPPNVDPDTGEIYEPEPGEDGKKPRGPSVATKLVELAQARYRFANAEDGRPFALPKVGAPLALPLAGSLKAELAARYFEIYRSAASKGALGDALGALEGMALSEDREAVHLRYGKHDGGLVIDLGTPDGKCVIVKAGRYEVVAESPIIFRRTELTMALPEPVRGGDIGRLAELVNVTPADLPLLIGWCVAALFDMPRPILFLTGEQGTGKSAAARALVQLLDPSPAPLRGAPKELNDWVISAAGSQLVALDNLSVISEWLSDALCRAVSGEGLIKRKLYEDHALSVLNFRRAVILTTIDAGALRGDLGERLLPVDLERLPADKRLTDDEVTAQFTAAAPEVFGAVLQLAAEVLEVWPTLPRPAELPRMADFARLLGCLDHLKGWDTVAAYKEAAAQVEADVLAGDALGGAVLAFMLQRHEWHGTATELLEALGQYRPEPWPTSWPKTPRILSGSLKRLGPVLRSRGVNVTNSKSNGSRALSLTRPRTDPPAPEAGQSNPGPFDPGPFDTEADYLEDDGLF